MNKATKADKLWHGVPWFRGINSSLGTYNFDAYLEERRTSYI